jgi:myo-inositol-1(or 4)-monophosphatase
MPYYKGMDDRIKAAERIIKHGGDLIHDAFHTSFTKREKTRHDYVTEIDETIEKLIDTEIKKLFPQDALLGEEYGGTKGSSGYLWIIDPLDGTNNFVKGIPQAGIQIAICKDEKVVYGVILNPFVQQMYVASKGHGAFAEDLRNGYRVRLQVSNSTLAESMMIFDSSIVRGDGDETAVFTALLGKTGWIRIFGVAVLDLPFLALGSADLLISNIPKPVDIAPGCLLIEEAGGVITDFDGKPWSPFSKNIVAGNKQNHAEALAIVADALNLRESLWS